MRNAPTNHRVDIPRRQKVIHGDAPSAGQRLALPHRPRLDNVKQTKQDEDARGRKAVRRGKKILRPRPLFFAAKGNRHGRCKTNRHGGDFIRHHRAGYFLLQPLFSFPAQPDGQRDAGGAARGKDQPRLPAQQQRQPARARAATRRFPAQRESAPRQIPGRSTAS